MSESCVLYDRQCTDCGECDMCDLNEDKVCDSCGNCISDQGNFRSVDVAKFIKDINKEDKE